MIIPLPLHILVALTGCDVVWHARLSSGAAGSPPSLEFSVSECSPLGILHGRGRAIMLFHPVGPQLPRVPKYSRVAQEQLRQRLTPPVVYDLGWPRQWWAWRARGSMSAVLALAVLSCTVIATIMGAAALGVYHAPNSLCRTMRSCFVLVSNTLIGAATSPCRAMHLCLLWTCILQAQPISRLQYASVATAYWLSWCDFHVRLGLCRVLTCLAVYATVRVHAPAVVCMCMLAGFAWPMFPITSSEQGASLPSEAQTESNVSPQEWDALSVSSTSLPLVSEGRGNRPAVRDQFTSPRPPVVPLRLPEAPGRATVAADNDATRQQVEDTRRRLGQIDEALALRLERGDIALLSLRWLLEERPQRLARRQDLEKQHHGQAHLSRRSAAELLRSGRRRVLAVSYGWRTPGNPDPTGEMMQDLIFFLDKFVAKHHISLELTDFGVFLDFGSLYQSPRTSPQNEAFRRALKVMASLYASAIGTCVLRYNTIPPRPSSYEGKVVVFGLRPTISDKAALLAALQNLPSSDHIMSVRIEPKGGSFAASLCYNCQGHAENAVASLERWAKQQDCEQDCPVEGACFLWNEMPLSGRGWPTLELAVAKEVLSLVRMPRMRAARELMANLPVPKLYDISDRGSPVSLDGSETQQSCEYVREAIRGAHFTSSADRQTVVELYQGHRLETFDKMDPDGAALYDLRWDNSLVDMRIERLRVGGQLLWHGRIAAEVAARDMPRLQRRAERASSLIPRAAHFVPIGVVQLGDYVSDLLVLARFWQQGGEEAMLNFYVGMGFVTASIVGTWILILKMDLGKRRLRLALLALAPFNLHIIALGALPPEAVSNDEGLEKINLCREEHAKASRALAEATSSHVSAKDEESTAKTQLSEKKQAEYAMMQRGLTMDAFKIEMEESVRQKRLRSNELSDTVQILQAELGWSTWEQVKKIQGQETADRLKSKANLRGHPASLNELHKATREHSDIAKRVQELNAHIHALALPETDELKAAADEASLRLHRTSVALARAKETELTWKKAYADAKVAHARKVLPFWLLKAIESSLESMPLSILTVSALFDSRHSAAVGGAHSEALLWMSVSLSVLSMSYGYFGLCATLLKQGGFFGEGVKDSLQGDRAKVFLCIMLHICCCVAVLGGCWGTRSISVYRWVLPCTFISITSIGMGCKGVLSVVGSIREIGVNVKVVGRGWMLAFVCFWVFVLLGNAWVCIHRLEGSYFWSLLFVWLIGLLWGTSAWYAGAPLLAFLCGPPGLMVAVVLAVVFVCALPAGTLTLAVDIAVFVIEDKSMLAVARLIAVLRRVVLFAMSAATVVASWPAPGMMAVLGALQCADVCGSSWLFHRLGIDSWNFFGHCHCHCIRQTCLRLTRPRIAIEAAASTVETHDPDHAARMQRSLAVRDGYSELLDMLDGVVRTAQVQQAPSYLSLSMRIGGQDLGKAVDLAQAMLLVCKELLAALPDLEPTERTTLEGLLAAYMPSGDGMNEARLLRALFPYTSGNGQIVQAAEALSCVPGANPPDAKSQVAFSEAHPMRGVLLALALQQEVWTGAGSMLGNRGASASLYPLSSLADRADYFVSHSPSDDGVLKVAMLRNFLSIQPLLGAAFIITAMISLLLFSLGYSIQQQLIPAMPWWSLGAVPIAAFALLLIWVILSGLDYLPLGCAPWALVHATAWVDRCCVDDSTAESIDAAVKSFPMFISKCDRMIALISENYFANLRCVYELATFCDMHERDLMDRLLLFSPTWPSIFRPSMHTVLLDKERAWLSDFRCREAICAKPADRAVILKDIRRRWQSEDAFDAFVHDTLPEILLESKAQYQRRMRTVALQCCELVLGD